MAVEASSIIKGKRGTPDYTLQVDLGGRGSSFWKALFFFDLKTTNQKFKSVEEAEERWLRFRHWGEGKLLYDEKAYVATFGRFQTSRGNWRWCVCDSQVPQWFRDEVAKKGGSYWGKKKF